MTNLLLDLFHLMVLIAEAERIAKESGYAKVAIIAGVGVREYYKKLGYENIEGYMVKNV
jgi:elongator complex protein 3